MGTFQQKETSESAPEEYPTCKPRKFMGIIILYNHILKYYYFDTFLIDYILDLVYSY